MKKNREDRICIICQKQYKYCRCAEYDNLPNFMDSFCSENCHDLYNITAGYINGWLDKEVEVTRLEKADISRFEYFPQWMKDAIKNMQEYKNEIPIAAISEVLEKTEGPKEKQEEQKAEDTPNYSEKRNDNYRRNKQKFKK